MAHGPNPAAGLMLIQRLYEASAPEPWPVGEGLGPEAVSVTDGNGDKVVLKVEQ